MSLDLDSITKLVKTMEAESKALKKELLKMCWFMRGGLAVSEAYMLDSDDREIINKIVEENLEVTKDTKLPFF